MIDTAAELLQTYAGLDPTSAHGIDTPARFLSMLDELTRCKSTGNHEKNKQHIQNCIKWKMFPAASDEMVIVQGIKFVSLCNHHLVPFIGEAHIGYVPKDHNAGLSKFARVVNHFARRLQVQEELTKDIADFLTSRLKPRGTAVILQAEHMCMTIRGVQSPGTVTTTSQMRGVFSDHARTAKAEFMQIITKGLK